MANFLEGLKQKYREILEPVTRTLSNIGNNAVQSWQQAARQPVGGLAGQAINQVRQLPQAVQNYQQQVQYYQQNPHFQFNQTHTPIKWLGEVAQDFKKRGPFEALHDLTYPITANPYMIPFTEPVTSAVRMANYKAGRPSPLINNLLGQTDAQMGIAPKPAPQTTPFVGGLLGQAVNTVKTYTPPVNSRPYNILQKLAPVQQKINRFTDFVQGKGPRAERFRQSSIAKMTPEEMAMNFSPMGVTNVAKIAPQAIKQIVKSKAPQDVIDTISETLLYGKNEEARQLYKEAGKDFILPKFEQLSSQVKKIISGIETEASTAVKNQFGDYSDVIAKMKQFLAKNAETSSGNMLYREHIPTRIFGVSSDEVSSALGMSESDFLKSIMPKITQVTKEAPKIPLAGGKLKTIKDILKLDENYKVGQSIEGAGMVPSYKNAKVYPLKASVSVEPKIKVKPIKTQEQAAKAEFANWQKGVFEREGVQTIGQAVKQAVGAVKTGTTSPLSKDVSQLKDISGFTAQTRDVYRNFKAVFGSKFEEAKRIILDPFDRSKGAAIDMQLNWINKLDDGVVKKLGIKRGSKESELVQLFGEKQITLDQLKQQAPNKWQQIVEADTWFRNAYNNLLGEVNKARQAIYPNNPDKIIPARQDYYRHFRDLQEGFGGLVNIFESPSGITSGLSGISEYTQPKSKFLSFAQKRLGMKSEIDAVGGFLDYIKSASYARNIDPHIERFKALADELATQTAEGANAGKLNNFIEYLQDFANDLSGKSNPADRFVQKIIPGGRQAFRAINWLNNRVKANVILGNAASSIAQIFNVPQGIASAGIPNSIRGVGKSLASIFSENKPMQQSVFLKERYFGFGNRAYDRFNSGMLHNTKKFAAWMVGALDEVGSRFIWNAHYEKALREGITNPIKYADDVTRSLVAGRGIGEVPLLQKSRLFQLVAPFQLEVGNLWYVMGDMIGEKAFGKLATLFVANYVFNRGAEAIRGSGVTFDPIQAMIDAGGTFMSAEDKKKGAIQAGGRLTGEVLGNLPVAQSFAQLYPEYGNKDIGLPTRKEFFGREDPTRFGSGLLTTKGLQDPLYKVLPPFGGGQIKKTIEGTQAFAKGYNETSKGQVRYPIKQTLSNAVRSTLFGQYATPENQSYFNENKKPLSEKQSELFKAASDQQKIYGDIMANRELNRQNQTQSTTSEDTEEDLARNKEKSTGQKGKQIKSVQINRPIQQPQLTGQTELDKKLISQYNSSITAKINDVIQLYKLNQLTADQANTQIAELKALQESVKAKTTTAKVKKITVKKAKKIAIPKIKALKFKIPKSKTIKVKAIKPKKIRIYKLSKTKKLTTNVKKIKLNPFSMQNFL